MTEPTTETTAADEGQEPRRGILRRIAAGLWWVFKRRQIKRPLDLGGFLWGFVVAALCLSIDAWSLVTRSLGLSVLQMLPLFAIGLVAGLVWLRPHDAVHRAWGVWSLLVGFVALLTSHGLFLHPDLVFSRAGALMVSPYMLTTGRAFPMLLAPMILGLTAGAVLPRKWQPWSAGRVMIVGCGVFCIGLVGFGTYGMLLVYGSDALLFDFCRSYPTMGLLGVITILAIDRFSEPRCEREGAMCLSVAVCAVGMLLTAVLADPYGGYAVLRQEFARQAAAAHSLRVVPDDVSSPSVANGLGSDDGNTYAAATMHVPFKLGHVDGEYVRGSWTALTASTSEVSAASVEIVGALTFAMRSQENAERFFPTIAPGFSRRWDSVESRTGWEPFRLWNMDSHLYSLAAPYYAVVFGPGALARREQYIVSREGLVKLRRFLDGEGPLIVWLPVGNIDPLTLRRILAGFDQVFDRYRVFAYGTEAVVVAGGAAKLKFAQWEELFENDGARRMLEDVGIWGPSDLLAGYVGDQDDLKLLTDGVEPFHKGLFVRAPILARAEVENPDVTAAAALLQYRMARPKRFTDALVFRNDLHRKTALLGFAAVYNTNAREALQGLVRPDDTVGRAQVRAFLAGPLARLDLLAAVAGERVVNESQALMLFGLRDDATAVLKAQVEKDQAEGRRSSFELHYLLGRRLEDKGLSGDALYQYRKALAVRPDAPDVLWRIRAIEERTGGRPRQPGLPGRGRPQ
jgi:hypothetical protein